MIFALLRIARHKERAVIQCTELQHESLLGKATTRYHKRTVDVAAVKVRR